MGGAPGGGTPGGGTPGGGTPMGGIPVVGALSDDVALSWAAAPGEGVSASPPRGGPECSIEGGGSIIFPLLGRIIMDG